MPDFYGVSSLCCFSFPPESCIVTALILWLFLSHPYNVIAFWYVSQVLFVPLHIHSRSSCPEAQSKTNIWPWPSFTFLNIFKDFPYVDRLQVLPLSQPGAPSQSPLHTDMLRSRDSFRKPFCVLAPCVYVYHMPFIQIISLHVILPSRPVTSKV